MALLLYMYLLLSILCATNGKLQYSPVAEPASVVISTPCVRFTVLTPRLIRVERSKTDVFDDRATFAIINRKLPTPVFEVNVTNFTTVIKTSVVRLTHTKQPCDAVGLRPGEVKIRLLVAPHTTWSSSHAVANAGAKSSVAHIDDTDPLNLNGTMNYGPSFAGGLDCYSNPPACGQRYRQIIGRGLLSRSGYAVVNDTNGTRMAKPERPSSITDWPPQWFAPLSTRPSHHILYDDIYFLASGLDFMSALSDFAQVEP